MSIPSTSGSDRGAGLGVLVAACVSALVVNANTSAVTILLPAILVLALSEGTAWGGCRLRRSAV